MTIENSAKSHLDAPWFLLSVAGQLVGEERGTWMSIRPDHDQKTLWRSYRRKGGVIFKGNVFLLRIRLTKLIRPHIFVCKGQLFKMKSELQWWHLANERQSAVPRDQKQVGQMRFTSVENPHIEKYGSHSRRLMRTAKMTHWCFTKWHEMRLIFADNNGLKLYAEFQDHRKHISLHLAYCVQCSACENYG